MLGTEVVADRPERRKVWPMSHDADDDARLIELADAALADVEEVAERLRGTGTEAHGPVHTAAIELHDAMQCVKALRAKLADHEEAFEEATADLSRLMERFVRQADPREWIENAVGHMCMLLVVVQRADPVSIREFLETDVDDLAERLGAIR